MSGEDRSFQFCVPRALGAHIWQNEYLLAGWMDGWMDGCRTDEVTPNVSLQ